MSQIEKRRKLRILEAKRDKMLMAKASATKSLAVIRAELKQERKK